MSRQIRFVFHIPFENSHPATNAIVEKATLTALKTPVGPKPRGCASAHARGISPIQRQIRLMSVGVRVSPAPLDDANSDRVAGDGGAAEPRQNADQAHPRSGSDEVLEGGRPRDAQDGAHQRDVGPEMSAVDLDPAATARHMKQLVQDTAAAADRRADRHPGDTKLGITRANVDPVRRTSSLAPMMRRSPGPRSTPMVPKSIAAPRPIRS